MAGKNKSKPLAWLITAVIAIAVVIIAVIMGIDSYEKVQLDYKKSTHPLMYSEYVEKYSAEYGLDKYIIYSVMVKLLLMKCIIIKQRKGNQRLILITICDKYPPKIN